ncbi:DUF262 domain-containing protein [Stenotrophomonas pavanii]|uniref:DUF262 domain-containing protein n=1 Tax=Stenotrophomonas pavanii TaxID=487698 RepID=UPI0039C6A11E
MKSDTWTIEQVFQDRKQYKVPFYQRPYVWSVRKQWPLLWADIVDKAVERLGGGVPAPHFLGAIVVEPQDKSGLRGVETYHIIDGQQRLTTLQYILAGIRLASREMNIDGVDSFLGAVMDNPNPSTMEDAEVEVFKVWPTFSDQEDFIKAMTAKSREELKVKYPAHYTKHGSFRINSIVHPPALDAIWYFAEQAEKCVRANGGNETAFEALIMSVLSDLKVVMIKLEKGDDAQVIFETLNGRGEELHATDLIRNYLFMTVDRKTESQQDLYKKKWQQFEDAGMWKQPERRGRMTKPRLEWLIFSAIRAETGQDGDLSRLYVDFKNYGQGRTATQQLDMLDLYGKHYLQLSTGKGAMPVARFGDRLRPFDTTTTHPLALRVSTADIDDAEKTLIFNDIVSYIVRRAICGLTPKNYNNFFMSVLRQWSQGSQTHAAMRALLGQSAVPASVWPDDAVFSHALQTAALYGGLSSSILDAPRCRMILTELEGWLRLTKKTEEPIIPDLSNLDIDHVMPQSWYEHWPLKDGSKGTSGEAYAARLLEQTGGALSSHQQDVQRRSKAIPTLGNLTLLNLSVNRQAQNKDYATKKKLFIDHTVLRLNGSLMGRMAWDEEAISERGKLLAEAAVQLYPR